MAGACLEDLGDAFWMCAYRKGVATGPRPSAVRVTCPQQSPSSQIVHRSHTGPVETRGKKGVRPLPDGADVSAAGPLPRPLIGCAPDLPTVARKQDSDQTLLIPIGIDPKLIDPKTWTNFTAPDSDIWPFLSLGSDSDSNSDSNIEVDIHESVVRIVFHYLNFAVGKNKATNLMNTMDTEDPNFAIATDVTEQSDDTCESVRVQSNGPSLAQLGSGVYTKIRSLECLIGVRRKAAPRGDALIGLNARVGCRTVCRRMARDGRWPK
jgi:hypothetical protein